MQQLDKVIEHAYKQCQTVGARLTTKRKQVLSGLIDSNKALSAYELMDICNAKSQNKIPAMSIYRILDFLEDVQLVHKLKLANKYVACAHICCGHEHGAPQFLICSLCSSVKEISIEKKVVNKINSSVKEAGYRLVSPQLEMNCICDSCDHKTIN